MEHWCECWIPKETTALLKGEWRAANPNTDPELEDVKMVTAPWLILLLVGCSSTNIWEGFHIRSTWFWAMKLFGWFYSPYFGCMFRANRRPVLRRADGVPCVSWMSLLVLQGFGVSRWVFRMVHRPKGRFWCLSLAPKWQNAVLHIHFGVSGQMWNTIDELPKNQMLENAHQYNVLYVLWIVIYSLSSLVYRIWHVWCGLKTHFVSLFLA